MIAVIDYGMGNIRSVYKALIAAGGKVSVVSRPKSLIKYDKIVLPGVGAFGAGMNELTRLGFDDAIKKSVNKGNLFLGLCLGLQLLFEESEESSGVKGLELLKGSVTRLMPLQKKWDPGRSGADKPNIRPYNTGIRKSSALKIPHMGWNRIKIRKQTGARAKRGILSNIPDGSFVYFVHSYKVNPEKKSIVLTTTDYGTRFVSGVHKNNIYAFQFHPEKSQLLGLKMLENFVNL